MKDKVDIHTLKHSLGVKIISFAYYTTSGTIITVALIIRPHPSSSGWALAASMRELERMKRGRVAAPTSFVSLHVVSNADERNKLLENQ